MYTSLKKMSDEEYFAHPALSNSKISLLLDCPARYKADERIKSDAFDFGSLFHYVCLENLKLDENKFFCGKIDKRTKEGKELAEIHKDKIIVSEEDYNTALLMREALYNDSQARILLDNKVITEFAYFWEQDGIECKAKGDLLAKVNGSHFLVDLKSTQSASTEKISKSIHDYGYYRQDAHYTKGLQKNGIDIDGFIFIFIEKTPPYLVTCVILDERAQDKGREECAQAIQILKRCKETGIYPCYANNNENLTSKILRVDLPHYAYNKGA